MKIGIQTWTIRKLFYAEPVAAFEQIQGFDFLELAGTGPVSCGQLGEKLKDKTPKVRGAHICSIDGARTDEVVELVCEYVEAFPSLEWVVFFFNQTDIQQLAKGEPSERGKIYDNYLETILSYESAITSAITNGQAPRVLYHLYPPDFWPDENGNPAFQRFGDKIAIQFDYYFAETSGFKSLKWLQRLRQSEEKELNIHSVHISGVSVEGRHAVLPVPEAKTVESLQMQKILDELKAWGVEDFIIEHEINPHTPKEALESLKHLKKFNGS